MSQQWKQWESVAEALAVASASLRATPAPVPLLGIADWIAARPIAAVTAGDSAVESWLAKSEWPPLGNDVVAELHIRLEAARMQADECQRSKMECPPEREAMRMLLIQFWHSMGLKWVQWRYGQPPN